jgi:membrane protein implicated in regulation of membrane protease activity
MDYMVFIWLAVVVMALICEGLTTALVSIWFVPGAIISIVLAALEVEVWIQTLTFFVVSVVCVVIFQSFFRKKLRRVKKTATNLDRLIGETAIVTEKVDNLQAVGCVKVNGQLWSARSESGNIIEDGEIVEIIAVSGVKLICRKK